MEKEILDKISRFLISNQIGKGALATDDEIRSIEEDLGFKLNNQYVDFVKVFGGTFAGVDVYYINNNPIIGKSTVIQKTNWFRASIKDEEYDKCLVFSDDGAGNPVFLNEKGNVMIWYHDSGGEVELLYESFDDMFNHVI